MKRVARFLNQDLQKFLANGFPKDYFKLITSKNCIVIKPSKIDKLNEKIILKNKNITIIIFTDKYNLNYIPIIQLNKKFNFWITKIRKFN